MLRYQRFVALAAVVIFSTNLGLFLFERGVSPVPPLGWIELFALASLPLLVRPGALRTLLASPIAVWCVGYFAINAFWFALGPVNGVAFETLRKRLLGLFFLLLASFWFTDVRIHRTVRHAFGVVIVGDTLLNVYDLFHPLQFSNVIGRAAGFYVNPNIAAAAILFMTVLAYEAIPPRWRMTVLVAGIIGVLLTASRGAALTAFVVLGVFWLGGRLQARQIVRWVAVLAVAAVGMMAITGTLASTISLIAEATSLQRARLGVGDDYTGDDLSTQTRRKVAEHAIDMFVEHPAAGAGIGATALSASDLTHDMYLMFMAEYGAVGILIFPALVIAVTWGARGEVRTTALAGAAFLASWALFSHNVLDEYQLLMCMALLAGMSNAASASEVPAPAPALLIGESTA